MVASVKPRRRPTFADYWASMPFIQPCSEVHMLAQVFEKHCINAWDDDRNAWRSCFSDEHYFATVLATQGLDEVTLPCYKSLLVNHLLEELQASSIVAQS